MDTYDSQKLRDTMQYKHQRFYYNTKLQNVIDRNVIGLAARQNARDTVMT